ncbi:hypothetical protein [Nocardia grenadensis]
MSLAQAFGCARVVFNDAPLGGRPSRTGCHTSPTVSCPNA